MFYYFLLLSLIGFGMLIYELKQNDWKLNDGSKITAVVVLISVAMSLITILTK